MLLQKAEYASTRHRNDLLLKAQYASVTKPICFSTKANMLLSRIQDASFESRIRFSKKADMRLPEYQYASLKNRICFYTTLKRFIT